MLLIVVTVAPNPISSNVYSSASALAGLKEDARDSMRNHFEDGTPGGHDHWFDLVSGPWVVGMVDQVKDELTELDRIVSVDHDLTLDADERPRLMRVGDCDSASGISGE